MEFRRIVPLLMALAAIIGSCGNGDDDTDAGTTGTAGSVTSTTTTVEDSTTAPSTTGATSSTAESTTTETSTSASTTTTVPTTTDPSTTASPTTGANRLVEVYFSTGDGMDCSEVTAFDRTVDRAIGPARAAFDELVKGPTEAEKAAGASSFFSADTADALLSVSQTGGVLAVDLADIRAEISNAGTSCGSAAFVSGLTATAFQFPTIDRVRFLFAGSCEDFGGFIQSDFCEFERDA